MEECLGILLEALAAVRHGDFSVRLPERWTGLFGRVADAFNGIVSANQRMAQDLARVSRSVGAEGRISRRCDFDASAGGWKEMEDSVNTLINDVVWPASEMIRTLGAVVRGDLAQPMPLEREGRPLRGEFLRGARLVNSMIDQFAIFTWEVTRVAREVGTEGKLGGQARVKGVNGVWKELMESVNLMAGNLTAQVRNVADVTIAVASGDLTKKITADVRGEILQLKEAINTKVDQLRSFAAEVTRVAREVGTEGKLGGQAFVPGVAGTWKDLTDSVNAMATNLTSQVRNIAEVTTAVARGDLSRKITVDVQGEIRELKNTINTMVDQLNAFAAEVTRVAREVGTEGKLGGQAQVPGAAGTWKDLTANVNLLAANLTNQVRAIADVATAVTKGDLTRSIKVEARGEVSDLKDNINAMISNLRSTTQRNAEQDWLKTNIAKFTRMLQGQRDLLTVGRMLLSELVPLVNAQQAVFFRMEGEEPNQHLRLLASYAHRRHGSREYIRLGEGLVGQCAFEKKPIHLTGIASSGFAVRSGFVEGAPHSIVILPVLFEGQTKAVLELASIGTFTPTHLAFLEQLTESIGIVLNTMEATMRTEGLLKQSQQLAGELQTRQTELQRTNQELAEKARQLADQNAEVERKNREIEHARRALEEKAAELALTSKFKSEFLANMSHELRTPLNSILILGQQLSENPAGNLTAKQVEFAKTIHSAGTDLLNLINDILDLSKIESGTVTVEPEEVTFPSIRDTVERSFRHLADTRNLGFLISLDPSLPHSVTTDIKRLLQVLKNLLSNAFKFTSQGHVSLSVYPAAHGWSQDHPVLRRAPSVVAFRVSDTGIGIPPEKQRIIFEAFQQADAGTSRKYGGTGLGLAISRELASLLGGEIRLASRPGEGSTFTLFLPQSYTGPSTSGHEDAARPAVKVLAAPSVEVIPDDRERIAPGDPVLLIVEDDPHYAHVLVTLAREKGFKGVVATRGGLALALARQFKPAAICLDIFLPDMLGWTVLALLKREPATRHIPVQILTIEEERRHSLERGAFGFLNKHVTADRLASALDRIQEFTRRKTKRLLLIAEDPAQRDSLVELLGHDDLLLVTANTSAEAWNAVNDQAFDCVVLHLHPPDSAGFELLERVQGEPSLHELPIVVFATQEFSGGEMLRLRSIAQNIVLKPVFSPDRLLDETALFLHRLTADLPPLKQRMLERLHETDEALEGRKVLVVDDDVRNIFALTGLLERHGMHVLSARNGLEAIQRLNETPEVAFVLMDIMMPGMDGYETVREIRKDPRRRLLPIVALTAKAMKGDREKCLESGASDYIAKPVNTEQLLSLMRGWLHR